MPTTHYSAGTYIEALEKAFADVDAWQPRHMAAIGNAVVSQTPAIQTCAVYYDCDDIANQVVVVRQVGTGRYQVIVDRKTRVAFAPSQAS